MAQIECDGRFHVMLVEWPEDTNGEPETAYYVCVCGETRAWIEDFSGGKWWVKQEASG